MSDPTFIEEIEPEEVVQATIYFRRQPAINITGTAHDVAVLVAAHYDRDPTARNVRHLMPTARGVISLELDEISAVQLMLPTTAKAKSLLNAVTELCS